MEDGGGKRKRRRWKATREILETIFGANGYKRGDWPRPIHHRVPPQLFPLRSPVFLLHPFAPLSSSSLSSLSRGGKRVAWLEIKHIHHDPRALSAVDKQASNNVMNFSSLPRCSFFDLPFPRWPSTDRGCETMVEAALSLFDGFVVNALPASSILPRWNSIPRFEIDSRSFVPSNRVVNSWRENFDGEKKKKEKKTRERIYSADIFPWERAGHGCSAQRDRWSDFRAKANERWTNEYRNSFTSLLMVGFTRGA